MKVEKLNENKIKITFNIDDLSEKNIDLYSFVHNEPESQKVFWDILNEVQKEYDFNVDNSMIYVEASTSGGGNFTLTVTKSNKKLELSTNDTTSKKNFKLKRKTLPLKIPNNIYEFYSFDDLCDFVRVIDLKKAGNDSLYQMNGKYYLKSSDMPFSSIIEYSNISSSPKLLEARLNEYGKSIINENALREIFNYFVASKKTKKS